ncbi:MAG: hypothetical protein QOI24_3948 [Acidobacteriota bacterium]|nr:hypothetical protein [Acidobacteriota bacterium]
MTAVILACLCGILIGIAADHAWLLYQRRIMPPHFAGRVPRMFVEHLSRKLDLTQQQRTEVEKILERRHARVEAIRASVRKEIDETNAEIDVLLTPEQRKKFVELKMKMAERAGHFPRSH